MRYRDSGIGLGVSGLGFADSRVSDSGIRDSVSGLRVSPDSGIGTRVIIARLGIRDLGYRDSGIGTRASRRNFACGGSNTPNPTSWRDGRVPVLRQLELRQLFCLIRPVSLQPHQLTEWISVQFDSVKIINNLLTVPRQHRSVELYRRSDSEDYRNYFADFPLGMAKLKASKLVKGNSDDLKDRAQLSVTPAACRWWPARSACTREPRIGASSTLTRVRLFDGLRLDVKQRLRRLGRRPAVQPGQTCAIQHRRPPVPQVGQPPGFAGPTPTGGEPGCSSCSCKAGPHGPLRAASGLHFDPAANWINCWLKATFAS
uniref:Transposase n=1 Tax=Macrostomum lignano TaxID=282301 RepID=A0A1I8F695_9PLAT